MESICLNHEFIERNWGEYDLLKNILKLILSVNYLKESILNADLSCSHSSCIAKNIKLVLKNYSKETNSNITTLSDQIFGALNSCRKDLISSSTGQSVLAVILQSFHSCATRENSIKTDLKQVIKCDDRCVGHSICKLAIEEVHKCRCGNSRKIEWEYSNFFHYFSVDNFMEKVDLDLTVRLLKIPKKKITEIELESNTKHCGKMIEYLKEILRIAEVDECGIEKCVYNKSKVSFSINSPAQVLIFAGFLKARPDYLTSFFSTLMITQNFKLRDLYGTSDIDYSLSGILFESSSQFCYANRIGNKWDTNGKSRSWTDQIKFSAENKLVPSLIVYQQVRSLFTQEINIKDLQVQERKLYQISYCETEFGQVFEVPKNLTPRSPGHFYYTRPSPQELNIKPVQMTEERKQPEDGEWTCKCGQNNKTFFDLCQKCREVKPGCSGWACKRCTTMNEDSFDRCSSCYLDKNEDDEPIGIWTCIKCMSINPDNKHFCSNCHAFRTDEENPESPQRILHVKLGKLSSIKLCSKCNKEIEGSLKLCTDCFMSGNANVSMKMTSKFGKK